LDAGAQLRIAGTGHIVGLDLTAALAVAQARGADGYRLSHLLPAIEAGLISGLAKLRDQADRDNPTDG